LIIADIFAFRYFIIAMLSLIALIFFHWLLPLAADIIRHWLLPWYFADFRHYFIRYWCWYWSPLFSFHWCCRYSLIISPLRWCFRFHWCIIAISLILFHYCHYFSLSPPLLLIFSLPFHCCRHFHYYILFFDISFISPLPPLRRFAAIIIIIAIISPLFRRHYFIAIHFDIYYFAISIFIALPFHFHWYFIFAPYYYISIIEIDSPLRYWDFHYITATPLILPPHFDDQIDIFIDTLLLYITPLITLFSPLRFRWYWLILLFSLRCHYFAFDAITLLSFSIIDAIDFRYYYSPFRWY
jgi:hypothetical protein